MRDAIKEEVPHLSIIHQSHKIETMCEEYELKTNKSNKLEKNIKGTSFRCARGICPSEFKGK